MYLLYMFIWNAQAVLQDSLLTKYCLPSFGVSFNPVFSSTNIVANEQHVDSAYIRR